VNAFRPVLRETHVKISDPSQCTNHTWLRNGVSGVQGEGENHHTSQGLSAGLCCECGRERTEERLHRYRRSEDEKEENAVMEVVKI
jgi:hypothetical protein